MLPVTAIKEETAARLLAQMREVRERFLGIEAAAYTAERDAAIAVFEEDGFPSTKNEAWKYTSLLPLLKKEFSAPRNFEQEQVELPSGYNADTVAKRMLIVNGLPAAMNPESLPKGFTLKSGEKGKPGWMSAFDVFKNDSLSALNFGLNPGTFLITTVPATGNGTGRWAQLTSLADTSAQNVFVCPQTRIHVQQNSELQLLMDFTTQGAHESWTNSLTEILVEEGATARIVILQNDRSDAHLTTRTRAVQKAGSKLEIWTVTLSGGIVRNDIEVILDGRNCETHLLGLCLADATTHVDNHTLVNHAKPDSFSNELYKYVMDGNSTGVFNGKIYVARDAQKTNAFQSSRALLLSDQASINAKPQLEIYADDVKCSHGATTGRLDETMLFYLRSRGLSESAARGLLTYAFAGEALKGMPSALRSALEALVRRKLGLDFDNDSVTWEN